LDRGGAVKAGKFVVIEACGDSFISMARNKKFLNTEYILGEFSTVFSYLENESTFAEVV